MVFSVTITQPTRVVGSLSTAVLQVSNWYWSVNTTDITLDIFFGQDIIGRRRCLLLCRSAEFQDNHDDDENYENYDDDY